MIEGRLFYDPVTKRFEDFALGDRIVTRGRTIDTGDIATFAGLTGNFDPLHMDAAFMEASRFGQRICHGSLTYSIAVGLVGLSGFYGDSILALIEVRNLKAHAPVYPGDTLMVIGEVVEMAADKANSGTLKVLHSVQNQRDKQVMTFTHLMSVWRQVVDATAQDR